MKKIKVIVSGALITAILFCIQGCSGSLIDNISELQQNKPEMEFALPEQIMELTLDLPIEIASTDSQESEVSVEKIEVSDTYYIYHKLDKNQQKLYLEIYDVLNNYNEDVILSTTDRKSIDELFVCVMNDHPELFYVDGYKCTEYSLDNEITEISFSGTYIMSIEDIEKTKKKIDEKIGQIMDKVPLSEDEYYTIKYIYEFLINNTQYNKEADNNQNICSVFLDGESVCQGYAKALQYLLHKAGIQCSLVTGFTNGERHAWNLVKINEEYYYIDPTWGDASYSYTGETVTDGKVYEPEINYDYFLVTTDEITKNHSIERIVELPECKSIEDNYFYREGLYIEGYDEDKIKNIFEALNNGDTGYITLKCSNKSVFEEMIEKLVDEKKIFDFMENQEKTIAYTSNDNQATLSFWVSDKK